MKAHMHPVEKLITEAGGKVESAGALPDGSGFMTASFPLPKDHWLTADGYNVPPMPFRCGTDNPRHRELCEAIRAAGRYAVRASTMNGREIDFDPDAMLQNFIVGLLGYHTADGTSSDAIFNPEPLPPLSFVSFV